MNSSNTDIKIFSFIINLVYYSNYDIISFIVKKNL